jgi:NAD(P)-dependent dehydrogenase (short-subunit alcohol dehydrogenase family)/acyl carrier protein
MCCVVTGGTKGLGLQYAKQLARGGCKRLVLTSRGGALPETDAAELAALGAEVHVVACDAGDAADCARLAAWLHESMPAVQVFAHAAGVLAFDLLPDLLPESFAAVVSPKAVGAAALARACLPVESALLFSSTAAAWSQPGAAHYSAANALLDAAAARWQAAGLPGTAVGFGPFADAGMAAGLSASMERVGLRPLASSCIGSAFAAAGVSPQSVHARLALARFAEVNTVKSPWRYLDELATTSAAAAPDEAGPALVPHPAAAPSAVGAAAPAVAAAASAPPPPAVALEGVELVVRSVAVELLGEGQLDAGGQFPAGGFDSLSAVELTNKIGDALGITLPGTLVFDYPSVPSISRYVADKLAPRAAAAPAHAARLAPDPGMQLAPTARPGEGCCLLEVSLAARAAQPAEDAPGPAAGCDAISVLPFERWDVEALKASPGFEAILPF